MTIYLVRHAKAGERNAWDEEDRLRPLSGRGHLQARGLLAVLHPARFDRLLSSPYVRCMETVVPLSGERGVAIEPVEALAEGATLGEATALVRKHAAHGAVFCTHGDVIPMLLTHYANLGVDIGADPQWPKGSTWGLQTDSTGEVVAASYIAPRSTERERAKYRRDAAEFPARTAAPGFVVRTGNLSPGDGTERRCRPAVRSVARG